MLRSLYEIVVWDEEGHRSRQARDHGLVIRPVDKVSGRLSDPIPQHDWRSLAMQGGFALSAVRRAIELMKRRVHRHNTHGKVLEVIAAEEHVASRADRPESNLAMEDVVERSRSAVASIRCRSSRAETQGAGFVIDPSGLILTNAHVIADPSDLEISLPEGQRFDTAHVQGYDLNCDLGLLQVAGWGLPFLPLSPNPVVRSGQLLVTIGHPDGFRFSASAGIVGGLREGPAGDTVIQTTVPVAPGNSGGPALNLFGEVIGVMTFGVGLSRGPYLSFAVPVECVHPLLLLDSYIPLGEFTSRVAPGLRSGCANAWWERNDPWLREARQRLR